MDVLYNYRYNNDTNTGNVGYTRMPMDEDAGWWYYEKDDEAYRWRKR